MGFYASNDERKGLTTVDKSEDFVSQDGKYLITNVRGDNTIVTDLETGYRVRTLTKEEDFISGWSYGVMSGDNKKIAYDYAQDSIVVTEFYDTQSLEEMATLVTEGRELTNDERNKIGLLERAVEDEE